MFTSISLLKYINLYIFFTSIPFFFKIYEHTNVYHQKNSQIMSTAQASSSFCQSQSMCDKPVSINCTRRENFHGREQLLSLTIIGWLQQYPWLAWLFHFCHFLWICKLQDPFSHFFDFPHTIILYTIGCFDPNIPKQNAVEQVFSIIQTQKRQGFGYDSYVEVTCKDLPLP